MGRTSIYKYIHILYHLCISLPFWKDSGMISYWVSYSFELREILLLYIIILVSINIPISHCLWKYSGIILVFYFHFCIQGNPSSVYKEFRLLYHLCIELTFFKNSLMISNYVINISVFKGVLFLYANIFVYLIICISHWIYFGKNSGINSCWVIYGFEFHDVLLYINIFVYLIPLRCTIMNPLENQGNGFL